MVSQTVPSLPPSSYTLSLASSVGHALLSVAFMELCVTVRVFVAEREGRGRGMRERNGQSESHAGCLLGRVCVCYQGNQCPVTAEAWRKAAASGPQHVCVCVGSWPWVCVCVGYSGRTGHGDEGGSAELGVATGSHTAQEEGDGG